MGSGEGQAVLDLLGQVLEEPVETVLVESEQEALALLHEVLPGVVVLALGELQVDLLEPPVDGVEDDRGRRHADEVEVVALCRLAELVAVADRPLVQHQELPPLLVVAWVDPFQFVDEFLQLLPAGGLVGESPGGYALRAEQAAQGDSLVHEAPGLDALAVPGPAPVPVLVPAEFGLVVVVDGEVVGEECLEVPAELFPAGCVLAGVGLSAGGRDLPPEVACPPEQLLEAVEVDQADEFLAAVLAHLLYQYPCDLGDRDGAVLGDHLLHLRQHVLALLLRSLLLHRGCGVVAHRTILLLPGLFLVVPPTLQHFGLLHLDLLGQGTFLEVVEGEGCVGEKLQGCFPLLGSPVLKGGLVGQFGLLLLGTGQLWL